MKIVLKVILFLSFIGSLYAQDRFLYPVYSVKLDKISLETMKILIVEKEQQAIKTYVKSREHFESLLPEYEYMLNLNNLLLLHKKTDKEYLYNLLGRISIDEDNKLKYEPLENIQKDSNYEMIEKKQSELKKNIEYVNQNKLSLETIKIILDVDLIDEDLGEELYSNKENISSVEKATKNLINCRFWEQMVNIYSNRNGCKIYSLCDDTTDYRNKWNYTVIYAVIIDDKITYLDMSRDLLKFFEDFDEKSNIYNQLNSKYISQTFQEWCVAQRDQSIPPEKECQPTDIKYFKKIK
jgi:hypothetical protein